ncbi:MAG: hypothetical protein WAL49_21435 [Pseudolabrys sp.]
MKFGRGATAQFKCSTGLLGFMAMNGTELYGETTVPKLGKIEAPHGAGLDLDPTPAVRDKFRV